LKNLTSILAVLLGLTQLTPCLAREVKVSNYPELRAACQSAQPDDVIVLEPGVYTIAGASRIMISNRPGPVTVRGATQNPNDVIVEGAGQDDQAVQMIFNLDDCANWTFENLTVRNAYYHGFKFDGASTDCVLRHVVMRDCGESGVKGTSNPKLGRYPDRLLIENCDIGFSKTSGGTRSVVEGIDGVGVNGWIIRHNRFLNVQHGGGVASAVFTKGNSSDTVIEANHFENCFIGASFGGGGTGAQYFRDGDQTYEHRGGMIRNNVFIHCSDAAIYINKGHECKIYNNTVFECVLTIQLRFPQSSGWVRNNLVKRAPSTPNEPVVRLRNGATLLAGESNLAANDADFLQTKGADEIFDLHLQPTSHAIDAGADVKEDVLTDCDGVLRPQGKGIDVGAYEKRAD
jgi:parallel beta-helix repeat protein